MTIAKKLFGENGLLVAPEGRLDIDTAVDFGYEINDAIDDNGIKELILDFDKILYISSIGLRVLLELQKRMNNEGSMLIKNVKPEVMEIFKMTGFDKIIKTA